MLHIVNGLLPGISCSLRTADVSFRSSPLKDVSRGGTSATQRQKFHTDDVNQCLLNKYGVCSEPSRIATKFNNFLADIGPSLASKVPSTQFSHKDFLVGHFADSFFLNPTSPAEVASIVHSLKNSKYEGIDGLSISSIKEIIDILAAALSHICNLSFEHGVFPDRLKIAKILPVFKSDDPSLFSNYRPLSILPSF